MIQIPVIVTFANQKGGVGKTTFCVTFANYLVTKGVRVVVVDCDFQHSIIKCRKADSKKYGEQQMPYDVLAYEANDDVPDGKAPQRSEHRRGTHGLSRQPESGRSGSHVRQFGHHRCPFPLRFGNRSFHRQLPDVHRPSEKSRR